MSDNFSNDYNYLYNLSQANPQYSIQNYSENNFTYPDQIPANADGVKLLLYLE